MNRQLIYALLMSASLACAGAPVSPQPVPDGTSAHPTLDARHGALLQRVGDGSARRCGLIDGAGKWVVAPEYEHCTFVGADLVFGGSRSESQDVEIIDLAVNPAVVHRTAVRGRPLDSSGGIVPIKVADDQYTLVDRSGNAIAKSLRDVEFSSNLPGSKGIGPPPFYETVGDDRFVANDDRIAACDDIGCGFLDPSGSWALRVDGEVRPFSEGRAIVGHGDRMVDTTGKTIVEGGIFATDLSEGHTIAQLDLSEDPDGGMSGQYFILDSQGVRIAELGRAIDENNYHLILAFSGGLATVWHTDTRRVAFVDTHGQFRDGPEGAVALRSLFEDRALFAMSKDGPVGYLDSTGAIAIPAQFGAPPNSSRLPAMDFSEGLAAARAPDGDRWGYIDVGGNWVIAPAFEDPEPFRGGFAWVRTNEGRRWIDRTGSVIVPMP